MMGPPGYPNAKQLGHFVEGFAGGVVAGVADVLVRPVFFPLLRQIKMGVTARHHQRQHGETHLAIIFLPLFEQHGMNVPFEMIDGDQGLIERESQRLGISDSYQQRPAKPGPWVTASASMD